MSLCNKHKSAYERDGHGKFVPKNRGDVILEYRDGDGRTLVERFADIWHVNVATSSGEIYLEVSQDVAEQVFRGIVLQEVLVRTDMHGKITEKFTQRPQEKTDV